MEQQLPSLKVCVFITGTNGVGKSTLVRALAERYGGVRKVENKVSYLANEKICLAGVYKGKSWGGVDRINGTSNLAGIVEEGLKHADIILCEGSMMDTFGLNLTNALFKAQKQLVVSLYADMLTIYNRLTARSNGKYNNGKRNWKGIKKKQDNAMNSARKFQQIGIPVLQINTAKHNVTEIVDMFISELNKIKTI